MVFVDVQFQAVELERLKCPASEQLDSARGRAAPARRRGKYVADFAAAQRVVDRHQVRRAEHASIVHVDDGEGRTRPGGEAGGHARQVLACVLPAVRARDERPARDLRVLADLDEPVDVAGLNPRRAITPSLSGGSGSFRAVIDLSKHLAGPDGRRRVAPGRPPAARSARNRVAGLRCGPSGAYRADREALRGGEPLRCRLQGMRIVGKPPTRRRAGYPTRRNDIVEGRMGAPPPSTAASPSSAAGAAFHTRL